MTDFTTTLHRLIASKGYKNQADDLIQSIRTRIDEDGNPKHIGEGRMAHVWWLSDRSKVLKVTTDQNDAKALQIAKMKPTRGVVKVYDVFEIVPKALWGIVAEKLTPLAGKELLAWESFKNAVYRDRRFEDEIWREIFRYGLYEDWITKFVNFGGTLPPQDQPNDPLPWEEMLDMVLPTLHLWAKYFESVRVGVKDIHEENIMMKGRQPTLVDLGFSRTPNVRIPTL